MLNKSLRPFLAKWHPLLNSYEARQTQQALSQRQHERLWEYYQTFRDELELLRKNLDEYAKILATAAGIDIIHKSRDKKEADNNAANAS
ncbi:MAG: hypothetical protein JW841_10585 [Deltaproteobacteria bacterium]|nr:hypothetical protein [Deltaproteobacteria bacterium]